MGEKDPGHEKQERAAAETVKRQTDPTTVQALGDAAIKGATKQK